MALADSRSGRMMSVFRRKSASNDEEKMQARAMISDIDDRMRRLRNEAAVITITVPKVKRA